MERRYRTLKLWLILLDVVVTVLSFMAAEHFRPYLPGRAMVWEDVFRHPLLYVMVALLWHVVLASAGAYDEKTLGSLRAQVFLFTPAYFFAVAALAGLLFFTFRDVSRVRIIYFALFNYFALLAVRGVLMKYFSWKAEWLDAGKTLVVGVSEIGKFLAEQLMTEKPHPRPVLGFVDDLRPRDTDLPAPWLGTTDQMADIIRANDVEEVLIALPEDRCTQLERLVFMLESLPVRIHVAPGYGSWTLFATETEMVGDLVLIGIREPVIRGHRWVAKRVLDIIVSSVAVIFGWPLMAAIAIAIKLDSPGPVLFVARRVGENGKQFNMYKFRTMVTDAEKFQDAVTETDEDGRPVYKVKEDPRVTRVGRILRRTSLDELPQFFNVLEGDMSLVGPRPEQPFITDSYDHTQWQRFAVPPGITGMWQISGRSELPMHLNTQYDLFYVRNYSLLLDLKILVKTLEVVIRGKGAY